MTAAADYTDLARQAEELSAWKAVRTAAGDVGRARRYGWSADRQQVLAEVLETARARLAAVTDGGETYDH
jgi:hypothetical protein